MGSTRPDRPHAGLEAADALAQLAAFASLTEVSMEEEGSTPHEGDVSGIATPSADDGSTGLRDDSTSAQTRQRSHPNDLPPTNPYGALSPSQVKQEPVSTPRDGTPSAVVGDQLDGAVDTDSLKAIEDLRKSSLGLRAPSRENSLPITGPGEATKPSTGPSKKRGPPKSVTKKGTAKKPPAKKRKVEVESNGTTGPRSGTPTSKAQKVAGKGAKKSQSATPAAGSSPGVYDNSSPTQAEDDSGSDSEADDALYCICRGRDDHTWMIGCDGCEDWFHGRCVNLNKDEHDGLLAKFICPNCESEGKGNTTWKPMCRRDGCRRPARQGEAPGRNKYCSDECGVQFFKNIVLAASRTLPIGPKKRTYTRRKPNADNFVDSGLDTSTDYADPPPRGGVLRARDVKALADSCSGIAEFQGLGSGLFSAPELIKVESSLITNASPSNELLASPTPADSTRLSQINEQKAALQSRRSLLKDREQFVVLVREQHTSYAEKEGIKVKDLCGFDSRLAWSDGEFGIWRESPFGRTALKAGKLDPEEVDAAIVKVEEPGGAQEGRGGEATMVNGEAGVDRNLPQICTKKRCDRHKQWQKLHIHDVRFEDAETAEQVRSLEREEKEIRERSLLRSRAELGHDGSGKTREGWVEALS